MLRRLAGCRKNDRVVEGLTFPLKVGLSPADVFSR
jgi:hypothetical protein